MIQLVIIEDDNGIRECLCDYLNMQPNMKCIATFSSVEDFLKKIKDLADTNIILLDINLPGMSGINGIKHIKSALHNTDIIMLTIQSNSEIVFQALCAGATGYLLKGTPLPAIVEAIIQQYNGGSAMSPTIARQVITRLQPSFNAKNADNNALAELTARELQVVQALADGLSYKLVADRLDISPKTVPVYIKNIYTKLQVHSKAEVISLYLKEQYKPE